MQDISSSKIPSIMELQKLKDWKKSLLTIPQPMDEALVKEFLLEVGYSQTDVRKYKTLRAWQQFTQLRGDCSHAGALLFVLCDIVSEGKTTLPADPTCTELPCSWSNPKGTSVDPVTTEQIHFYKSRFDEQPLAKKFRATPTVSVQFFGVSRNYVSEETDKQMKQNLKMAILAANKDKSMPPVYYLLKCKFMKSECAFAETHKLPKELDEDDPRLLPGYAVDVEATPHVQISSDNVSLPQIISAPCQKTPKENTTLLLVISPAEQCKSSKESQVSLVPVTLFCENGTFDEENTFQPPITYPVQIPSIPPMSYHAFDFYNYNNVKVSIQQHGAGKLKKKLSLNPLVSFGLNKENSD
ncbi:uncharacterized protein LOC111338701 [Stylophora pistillata]|uniref:uncharacterized protein LOC111338701 n=1 Tax=Stylophora pistillata TaxID=50429 RepID=UPI000C03D335|nr:uncharacterized protein LOC111338701 [Stylophora pistillata]